MQTRAFIVAGFFLAMLGVAVYLAWYGMQTPQFEGSLQRAPEITEEQKINTLESLRPKSGTPPAVSGEAKVETLHQLSNTNIERKGSTNPEPSKEDKLKMLENLHGVQ